MVEGLTKFVLERMEDVLWNSYVTAMADGGGTGEFLRLGKLTKPLTPETNTVEEFLASGREIALTALAEMHLDDNLVGLQVNLHCFLTPDPGNILQHSQWYYADQEFATLLILQGDFLLTVRHYGEKRVFDFSGLNYAVFFKDAECEVLPMSSGFCGVFGLSGECQIPEKISPWGFFQALLAVRRELADWFEYLESCLEERWLRPRRVAERRHVPLKFVIVLDHEYPPESLTFATLREGDRLLAGLLLANPTLDVYLCSATLFKARGKETYRLGYGVSVDNKPANLKTILFSRDELIFTGRFPARHAKKSVIVMWLRSRRIDNVGFERYFQEVVEERPTDIAACIHHIVNHCSQEKEDILKVMELCADAGTSEDCNRMILQIGSQNGGIPYRELVPMLVTVIQKHGWQACSKSILEYLITTFDEQPNNIVALALELNAVEASTVAKEAALAVAQKLIMISNISDKYKKRETKKNLESMVRKVLGAEIYLDFLMPGHNDMADMSVLIELLKERHSENLSNDIIWQKLVKLEWLGKRATPSLMFKLLMLEDKRIVEMVVSNVNDRSREEAIYSIDTLAENLLFHNPNIWEAASGSRLIAGAIRDIANNWIDCIKSFKEPEFSWRQPDAVMRYSCLKPGPRPSNQLPHWIELEEGLRKPCEFFYVEVKREEQFQVFKKLDGRYCCGASATIEPFYNRAAKLNKVGGIYLVRKTRAAFYVLVKCWKRRKLDVSRISEMLVTMEAKLTNKD